MDLEARLSVIEELISEKSTGRSDQPSTAHNKDPPSVHVPPGDTSRMRDLSSFQFSSNASSDLSQPNEDRSSQFLPILSTSSSEFEFPDDPLQATTSRPDLN